MTKKYDNQSPLEVLKEITQIPPSSSQKEIDETQYPLTFKQFTTKFTDKLITSCKKQYQLKTDEVKNDLKEYLQENPTTIQDSYTRCCEYYDLCKKYYGKQKRAEAQPIVSPQIAFNAQLNYKVYQVGDDIYFF